MEKQSIDRKKLKKIICLALCGALIITGVLCGTLIPLTMVQQTPSSMEILQKAIVQRWVQTPVTVENKLEITTNGQTVIAYNNKYIIQNDTDTASFYNETIYCNDREDARNSIEEYYLTGGKIHMKKVSTDGEMVRNYPGNMPVFKEIILNQADKYYDFTYAGSYFAEFNIEYFEDTTEMFFVLKDENIKDFLGDSGIGLSNLTYYFVMLKNGNIIDSTISFDMAIENGQPANARIRSSVDYSGQVELPEWVV